MRARRSSVKVLRILSAAAILFAAALAAHAGATTAAPTPRAASSPPNILFIVLDDVGVDQLAIFNPSPLASAPRTPSIDAIAGAGVRFTRFYTMPECSPSRVAFFTGRYPFRTGVTAALLPEDLPSAQLSPYEVTTPKVLATRGYTSAMIGKYHLGGPDNNPDRYRTPAVLGWDYYIGNFSGGPSFLDTTLGGQYLDDPDRYSCGLPLGPEKGACWRREKGKQPALDSNGGAGYTGKECAALGGIPALDGEGDLTLSCPQGAGCTVPDFSILNGYYVWPRVAVEGEAVRRTTSRQYMTSAETDASIAWIRRQSRIKSRPWMLTVSYSSDHIPYQPPPDDLLPEDSVDPPNCTDLLAQRQASDLMIEAMDHEIGRLLVGAGLAVEGSDGSLDYTPEATNTMIVLVGDNGSFLPSVKLPYNPVRSKASVYETGVLTPLVVAGPLVEGPPRTVEELVGAVDLFQLFGEIAAIDVRSVVPPEHVLDSYPVLPYLENPSQQGLRSQVFTQVGSGRKPPSLTIPPCVISLLTEDICTDILLTSEELCVAAGGASYGPMGFPPEGLDGCCGVKEAQPPIYTDLQIVPDAAWAIRNERFKLVVSDRPACDDAPAVELYDLQATRPLNPLGLDNPDDELLAQGPLDADAQSALEELRQALDALLATEIACPGDGNLDKRVDGDDLAGVQAHRGRPSVFDFDNDGVTGPEDLRLVRANLGRVCS